MGQALPDTTWLKKTLPSKEEGRKAAKNDGTNEVELTPELLNFLGRYLTI
jgi:hypothetical protein